MQAMAKMKIKKQQSEGDIYNVQGDLNLNENPDFNGAILNVNHLILNKSEGFESELMKAEQKILAAGFSVSYLDFIKEEFDQKKIVDRQIVKNIWQELEAKKQLLLTGIPGSGKSCILFQLSALATDVVYISVRDRSLLNVLNHLINKIRIKLQEKLIVAGDTEEALDKLQVHLQSCRMVFLIDDCEAAVPIVLKLITLHKGNNQFVFASRNEQLFESTGIGTFPVTSFTEHETKQYLVLCGIELDILSFNKLYQASGGNALYLFYFSNYQIDPLPADIDNYHKAIWAALSAEERECLIYIALAYRRVTIDDLFELLQDKRLTETSARLTRLASLVINQQGMLQLFHPAFKEYINGRLRGEGLYTSYSEKLGNYFLNKNKLVDAAWLLIESQSQKVNSFGMDALPPVIISGDLHFAVKLINTLLTFQKTALNRGYLEYHLSCVHRFLHQEELSETHLVKAIEYFKKIRDKHWLLNAEMVRAMNLVEKGKNEEGLALADSIFLRSEKFGDKLKGRNLVNLTKIYIDLTEYDKGARAAKEAFDIFEKNNEPEGMVASLANLSSCLAKMDDYSDLAETYALKLLNLKTAGVEFTIKLIALNILTSVNRQKKNFIDAKKYGNEAIKLCQKYDLPDKLILNLVNYGNIIRDEKKIKEAIEIYAEALGHAKDLGLKKDEGRIYWILSSVYRQMGEFDKSLDYAEMSIVQSKEINYSYGIAHATESKAKTLEKKGEKSTAAAAYEESAKIFLTIENFSKDTKTSFSKAILLYFETGEAEKANRLLALSIMDVPHNNFEELEQVIREGNGMDLQDTIHQSYLKLADKYGDPAFVQNTVRKFMVYLDYCHSNMADSKTPFLEVLCRLASHTGTNRFALTTLGILVEQSRKLLDTNDLNKIIEQAGKSLHRFNYRDTVDESMLLASITDVLKIQMGSLKDDLLAKKLLFTAVLFLYAAPELVINANEAVESFYSAQAIDLDVIRKEGRTIHVSKKEFNEHIQTVMLRTEAGVPDAVYINTEYEKISDLIKYPNNKCLMYFLGMFILGATSHFYKEKINPDKNRSKFVSRKLAYFFDYTNIEDMKKMDTSFGISLGEI